MCFMFLTPTVKFYHSLISCHRSEPKVTFLILVFTIPLCRTGEERLTSGQLCRTHVSPDMTFRVFVKMGWSMTARG